MTSKMQAGDRHYKAWIGPPQWYDIVGGAQFAALFMLGLREHHKLLDIGCGSLRLGKLLLPYLSPGNYYGIEPEKWVVEEGIKNELGQDIIDIKKPQFNHNSNFNLSVFEEKFNFVIAQSIFSHASFKQINACMTSIAKVLKPNGVFMFNWQIGNKDYTEDKWVYPGVVRYTMKTMESIITKNNMVFKHKRFPLKAKPNWTIACLSKNILDNYKSIKDR